MKVLALIFFVTLVYLLPISLDAQANYEVVEFFWIDSVLPDDGFNFVNKLQDTTEFHEPLIWIKMKCNDKFLSELDSTYLPFKFKWISKGLVDLPKIRDPHSELEVTQDFHQLKTKYRQAIDEKGYFELVVWSGYDRNNMKSGLWQVKFLTSNNKPIKCDSDDCVFEIYKK